MKKLIINVDESVYSALQSLIMNIKDCHDLDLKNCSNAIMFLYEFFIRSDELTYMCIVNDFKESDGIL